MARRSLINLAGLSLLVFLLTIGHLRAQNTISKLLSSTDSLQGPALARAYCDLCWEYRFVDQDSAEYYCAKAIKLANQSGDDAVRAQAYNDNSIILIDQANYYQAIEYLDSARILREALNDSVGLGSVFNKIGIAYQLIPDYPKSLKAHQSAISIYQDLKLPRMLAQVLNNEGLILYRLNRYDAAVKSLEESIRLKRETGDTAGIGGTYVNIGDVFYHRGAYSECINYYHRALHLVKNRNEQYYSMAAHNLASTYVYLKQTDSAAFYLAISDGLRKKLADNRGLVNNQITRARLLSAKGNHKEAEMALDRAFAMADSLADAMDLKESLYLAAAKIYRTLGDPDKTFDAYYNAFAIHDSILGEQNRLQLAQLENQFENLKKEAEIERLQELDKKSKLELAKKEEENRRQRRLTLYVSILLSLVLIAAIALVRLVKLGQKNKLQEKEISFRKALLNTSIAAQEEERKRIAKELHDGIAQSLSALKMSFSAMEKDLNFSSEDGRNRYDDQLKSLDNACDEVRGLSHQMMPRVLLEKGLSSALDEMCNRAFQGTKASVSFESYVEEARYSEEIEVNLFRIGQELTNNIIKHSKATEVYYQLLKSSNHLVLAVEDNGIGFDPGNAKGGIGIGNIESRVNVLNGKLQIESSPGKGSSIRIRIPLNDPSVKNHG